MKKRRHADTPLRRIGVFGGTFNPIHVGHVKMAEAARKQFKLSLVYFMPCGVPPHRKHKELYPLELRHKLVKKVVQGKKYFKLLDIEIKKKKKAYTYKTIQELKKKKFKNKNIYFLIGQDAFKKLNTWQRANMLSKMVTFLVLPRTGKITVPKIKNLNWRLVKTKPINISSTEIRERVKRGKSVEKLLPADLHWTADT